VRRLCQDSDENKWCGAPYLFPAEIPKSRIALDSDHIRRRQSVNLQTTDSGGAIVAKRGMPWYCGAGKGLDLNLT
jgi:hypothetical protein